MSENTTSIAITTSETVVGPKFTDAFDHVRVPVPDVDTNGEVTAMNPINTAYEQVAELCETPQQLRDLIYEGMYSELQDRVIRNPDPSEEELRMGAYIEAIEPQARDAVLAVRNKGYNTASTGFENANQHLMIQSSTTLPTEVLEALGAQGYSVETMFPKPEDVTDNFATLIFIAFRPIEPTNLREMKIKWDELVTILPELGKPAPPTEHPAAEQFRSAARANTLSEYVQSWDYRPYRE